MEEELSELRNVKEQMKKMEEKMNLFCLNRESNKSLIRYDYSLYPSLLLKSKTCYYENLLLINKHLTKYCCHESTLVLLLYFQGPLIIIARLWYSC